MASRLTPFGKEIRRLRIEKDLRLIDMASTLQRSPAYLSAVETGKKPVPPGLVGEIVAAYELQAGDAAALQKAVEDSRASVTLKSQTPAERELVAAFARRFSSLDDDDRQQLLRILTGAKQ